MQAHNKVRTVPAPLLRPLQAQLSVGHGKVMSGRNANTCRRQVRLLLSPAKLCDMAICCVLMIAYLSAAVVECGPYLACPHLQSQSPAATCPPSALTCPHLA
jgi:hypothetical protein